MEDYLIGSLPIYLIHMFFIDNNLILAVANVIKDATNLNYDSKVIQIANYDCRVINNHLRMFLR